MSMFQGNAIFLTGGAGSLGYHFIFSKLRLACSESPRVLVINSRNEKKQHDRGRVA